MGPPSAPSRTLEPPRGGDRIGPYRIEGELGRGGMGVVYRAEDTRLGRPVALKFLPAHLRDDAQAKARLMVEARAAAALDHPHVCTVYEVAEADDGRPYIAFACYEGEALSDRLAAGPLAVGEAVRIAREVGAGLAAAHARGIVHRDLKPSNVFLCEDGTAKILDFGIARIPGVALTATGETAGTVEYGAPETLRGQVDERSDVWSLGVVLYEMLTGRRPFAAPYEAAVVYAVLHEDPKAASRLNAAVSEELDAVIARCLAKDPDERYPDASALLDALAPPEAEQSEDLPTVLRRSRRALVRRLRQSRAWQAGAAAAVLAVVVLAVGVTEGGGGEFGIPDDIVLAILPPTPRPDGTDDRAFSEGLAEMLASGITLLRPPDRSFSVTPVSDVKDLRITSARQAAAVLGANLALMGNVQREPGRILLTLNLTTAGDQPRILATHTVSLAAADESQLRARALTGIAQMLGFAVAEPDDPSLSLGTADVEAQRFYLAGLGYLDRDEGDPADLDRAVDQFQQAIREDSMFARAYAKLGQAYLARYEETRDSAWVGRARDVAERAEALDPTLSEVRVTLSQLHLTTGEYRLAMQHARRALQINPASLTGALALSDAQVASGDVVGAEQTLKTVVEQYPSVWTGPDQLGRFYFGQARYAEAAAAFERAVALAPDNYKAHLGRGGAYQMAGDTERASEAYERVIDLRPDHYATYSNLGILYQESGRHAEALAVYQKALAADSMNHLTWRNLASGYSDVGDEARRRGALRGAVRRATAALDVNPSDAEALVALATYRQALGADRAAVDAARQARVLAPASPKVQYDAARVLALSGDRDGALDALAAARDAGQPLSEARDDEAFASLVDAPRFRRLADGR